MPRQRSTESILFFKPVCPQIEHAPSAWQDHEDFKTVDIWNISQAYTSIWNISQAYQDDNEIFSMVLKKLTFEIKGKIMAVNIFHVSKTVDMLIILE